MALVGRVDPAAVDALNAVLDLALEQRRHVLLNFLSCDYLDPKVADAIDRGRESHGKHGLDVLSYGASGVVRALLALSSEEEFESPAPRRSAHLPALRPSTASGQ
ncbi:MAG TPA: hypothetical protein VII45_12330 [Solirubrobacterales bacterium]